MGDGHRLLQVAQHAADLDRDVAFYRDVLGLKLQAVFDPPGLAFFDLGETRLLLETNAPPALLYLEVGNIDAEHARLVAAGVEFLQGPHLLHRHDGSFAPAGPEEWMAFFHDSEENLLAIAERRQS
ncbi:MAG: VOC family protein [Actinobacteria bacterium]|nr:MAG: VOC family protein [Actinomycetota bacterium]